MSSSVSRPGEPLRIAIAADGTNLVLDEAARAGLARCSGQSGGADGPALASPFAGRRLLAWLGERIGNGQAVWTLRTVGGERVNLQISPASVDILHVQGKERRGDTTTKPVHDVRNHLNIVQTTAELLSLTAERTYGAGLAEPVNRILRQIPPMSDALEVISARERERAGSRHSVLGFLRGTIDRTAWAGRLVVDSDSGVAATATYCDAIARSALEWASHDLARHGSARLGVAESSDGTALEFKGPGIGEWVTSGDDSRFDDWLLRWEDLDVSAGAWATSVGGGALIGMPR
jgi:hypothetical protein